MTEMVSQSLSLPALVSELLEVESLTAERVAELLLEREGPELFLQLPYRQQRKLLADGVRQYITHQRRLKIRACRVSLDGLPYIRVEPTGNEWATLWSVRGQAKQLRELTLDDVRALAEREADRIDEARARLAWWTEVGRIARQHKVSVLGDLERKGIALPTVDSSAERA